MDETDFGSVEHDTRNRGSAEVCRAAIEAVAQNGETETCQMYPDLVGPAGSGKGPDEQDRILPAGKFKVGMCFITSGLYGSPLALCAFGTDSGNTVVHGKTGFVSGFFHSSR